MAGEPSGRSHQSLMCQQTGDVPVYITTKRFFERVSVWMMVNEIELLAWIIFQIVEFCKRVLVYNR